MDINIQLFTGSCNTTANIDILLIKSKLNKILKKTNISNAFIGWNKDTDLSEIISLLKYNGTSVYLWLPVFSELDALTDFSPVIGSKNEKLKINFDMGNDENFMFYCPADIKNLEKVIEVYEKHYDKGIYDGVFLDKIRFPSFIGGVNSVLGCFCDFCRSNYDLPEINQLFIKDSINPLGIIRYKDLHYDMNDTFKKLFDYKCDAIFNSLKFLCTYFRNRGLKIGIDLVAPFLAYFVGQDYYRLLALADIVKPMFYGMTNAPAGLPFEINMYAQAFDDNPENAHMRKKLFIDLIGYEKDFINSEITGINKIIKNNNLSIRLYAGIELNYIKHIAPVTKEYIIESVTKIKGADGIVTSWDLNTTPDNHIDYLLDAI